MDDPTGLGKPLYEPANANVDIVFVHGLGGHRTNTWTFQPTTEIPTTTFWPQDLLPQTCKTARILSFGYDSSFISFFPFSGPKSFSIGTTIDDHSSALLGSLTGLRSTTKSTDRPIIFIAHSLGGLVVANALSRHHGANNSNKELVDRTRGAIFLGTPFEGSAKARWGLTALKYLSLFTSTKKEDVKDLEERSQRLITINSSFLKFLKERDRDLSRGPMEVACFFEEHPTFVAGKNVGLIVQKSSARSLAGIDPIPISASHSRMCKFPGDYANGYTMISELLVRWINALEKSSTDSVSRSSISIGPTYYNGAIHENNGVIAGNINSTTYDGVRLTGATVTVRDVMENLEKSANRGVELLWGHMGQGR